MSTKSGSGSDRNSTIPKKPDSSSLEKDEDWFYHPDCNEWRIYTIGQPQICIKCRLNRIQSRVLVIAGQVHSADDTEGLAARLEDLNHIYEAGT